MSDLKAAAALLPGAWKHFLETRGPTLALALGAAVLSVGIAEAASRGEDGVFRLPVADVIAELARRAPPVEPTAPMERVWTGADIDGDGHPDLANPTGGAPRGEDAYGEGRFHASRDGGSRRHEGVDYVARAGQAVDAPISGFVTKVGFAYARDKTLKFVEIDNPALGMAARVFYLDPDVGVGDAVEVGEPIGKARTLKRRYPRGITDHVHLEIEDRAGRKLDAETLIMAVERPAQTLASN